MEGLQSFRGSAFRGEPYESVSPLVKVILAVTADGKRYRLGHYGAITKVPRGNVADKEMLLSPQAASHIAKERKAQPFPSFFRKPLYRAFGLPEG